MQIVKRVLKFDIFLLSFYLGFIKQCFHFIQVFTEIIGGFLEEEFVLLELEIGFFGFCELRIHMIKQFIRRSLLLQLILLKLLLELIYVEKHGLKLLKRLQLLLISQLGIRQLILKSSNSHLTLE